jgi:peptidyl-prolyl cis-trans isomerase A (cyclophilin A)
MRPNVLLPFAAAALLLLSGCSGERKTAGPARKFDEPSPAVYKVNFETSKGNFVVEVHRDWAPKGADRFYTLVNEKYYDEARFFRVVRNFVVQWGIAAKPATTRFWQTLSIADDPVKQSNKKGYLSFAMAGPASRTTQVFINLRDNTTLDQSGFAPFGQVVEGMDVVENLYLSYGDGPPRGNGPVQDRIRNEGNAYLESQFPRLDFIKTARVMP